VASCGDATVVARGAGVVEQAFQAIEGGVERRRGLALDPLAVPASVGEPVLEEPLDDAVDVSAQP